MNAGQLSGAPQKTIAAAPSAVPAPKANAAPTSATSANAASASATDLITLGTNVVTGAPFTILRSVLGHMHVRGMSGSGKGSLTLVSLISQLLGASVFVIDLGGDQNVLHNVSRSAKAKGISFRYLTLDPDLASFHFPIFQTLAGDKLHVTEISQRLIRSFNLDFGAAVYGATYYASQALAAMLSIAKKVFAANPAAALSEVDLYLNRPENKRQFKDADSIRMNVRFLLEYPILSAAADQDKNILIERAIENSEVTYFFCPTLEDPIVAPLVGGTALANILHIAIQRVKRGKPKVPIFVVIDEFQEIVGRSLAALLAQGRKYGLRFILANQSTSQLETRDSSLVHAVFENTSVKQYFTALDSDIELLQTLSKDKIRALGGTSAKGLSTSVSFRDTVVPTLERDEVLSVSATFGRSFFVVNDGLGHKEPVVVDQVHEFSDLSNEPMPRATLPPKAKAPGAMSTTAAKRAKAISELLAKKKAEETWALRVTP